MVQVRICETFDILRVQLSLLYMVLVRKVLRIQLDTGLMKLRLIMFILKVQFNIVLRVRIIKVFCRLKLIHYSGFSFIHWSGFSLKQCSGFGLIQCSGFSLIHCSEFS